MRKVSKEALADALRRLFDMEAADAEEIAGTIASQFEAGTEVRDDQLSADLRMIFYTLESKRLLAVRREEFDEESGEMRRVFHWRMKPEEIERAANVQATSVEPDVYDRLPASAWARTSAA
ncbi:MAG: hypothetical protein ACT4PT_10505 [Methanobacteriota archaeon]